MFPSISISSRERNPLFSSGGSASFHTNTPVLLSKNGTRSFRNPVVCAGFKGFYAYPKLTAKPRWWWRTAAAVPYLLPLHNVWQYADAVYHLHPVLEKFEFLANPFLDTMGLMPGWLIITLFMGTYFLVVRRKELPHFLRFHVVMALLFDTGFQALATALNWLPRIVYKSQFMVYFWMAFAFSQAYTVFECMRCALIGTYHDVPFWSDAAYIHVDPKLLNF
jgi:uncharacterized membrane protein